ncbi:MAG: hypothetical protein H6609_16375 [Ignavibacteriales bacterium]|nr:hypothetical protein [Ignavibacteriales bacterium]
MSSRLHNNIRKIFNTENPQRDILLELLDNDREFAKKFLELYEINIVDTSYLNLKIFAEYVEHFGRADLIFVIDKKIFFQIEVKNITKPSLDDEDKNRFNRYLSKISDDRKIGLLLKNPHSSKVDNRHDINGIFIKAISWTQVGELIKEHFINSTDGQKNPELFYWSEFIYKFIMENKIMRETMTKNDLIAFNIKDIASQKLNNLLINVFENFSYFKNDFLGFNQRVNNRTLYDNYDRIGLQIVRGDIGCFWGILYNVVSEVKLPKLYAMIEVPLDKNDIRNLVVEKAKSIVGLEKSIINNNEKWQVIELFKDFDDDFPNYSFEKQIDYLSNWFDEVKANFEILINSLDRFA